uniref:Uncharacterized protein n=1 Tax=Cacopsylla melanoneura TaxID=428564 RepID=A0A8D9BLH6_9HEMI
MCCIFPSFSSSYSMHFLLVPLLLPSTSTLFYFLSFYHSLLLPFRYPSSLFNFFFSFPSTSLSSSLFLSQIPIFCVCGYPFCFICFPDLVTESCPPPRNKNVPLN